MAINGYEIVIRGLSASRVVGLAGGVALGQSFLLLLLSFQLHLHADQRLLIILIVLLVVFLSFNMRLPWRKHASIFLGDSGSTFIAFLLAWFAINLSQENIALIKPMSVLWVMAFPLFDLVNVTILRIRQKKSIFAASRDHFHHVLHLAGVNTTLSTLLLCALSFLLGAIGLMVNQFGLSEGGQFLLWLATLIVYILVVELTRKPTRSMEIVSEDDHVVSQQE